MAVSTTSWNATFTGDGTTTTFLCAFPLMETEDLKVYVDDVLQTENREYTLTGVTYTDVHTVNPNYSVVFTEAPASGTEVYIRRQTPRWNSNTTSFGDVFSLPVFENNYDNLVMIFQEIGGLILEGFQGPAPEIVPSVDYEPQSSGFFPAKIIEGPDSGFYRLRAAIPTENGGWSTTSLPVLTSLGAEINLRTDLAIGDVVLVLPIADSSGEDAWRFVGNQTCGDIGGPTYSGPWYDIVRCDNTGVLEIAWVRGDEFSAGDEFMFNGVCYQVQATSPASDPPAELVIRVADTTSYADCTACLLDQDPEDPNVDNPPFPGTRFRDMARCSDDSTNEFSLPIEYFGIPTNHDLTKIYETSDGVCYYVSEIETATPNNPLFAVQSAGTSDTCEECGCNPGNNCSFCDTETPDELVVTLSGINTCICADRGGAYQRYEIITNLNDRFTLPQLSGGGGNQCVWTIQIENALTVRTYSDAGCNTTLVPAASGNLNITLAKRLNSWTLLIQSDNVPVQIAGSTFTMFFGETGSFASGGDELCTSFPTIASNYVQANGEVYDRCGGFGSSDGAGGGNYGTVAAYGGVATIACQ